MSTETSPQNFMNSLVYKLLPQSDTLIPTPLEAETDHSSPPFWPRHNLGYSPLLPFTPPCPPHQSCSWSATTGCGYHVPKPQSTAHQRLAVCQTSYFSKYFQYLLCLRDCSHRKIWKKVLTLCFQSLHLIGEVVMPVQSTGEGWTTPAKLPGPLSRALVWLQTFERLDPQIS